MQEEKKNRESSARMGDYEAKRREVRRFNLTSDVFFSKVMEDKLACQDLIRVLTGDQNLTVREVKSQYSIRNLETHSVVLDVLAEAGDRKLVCVEIHLGEDEDHVRRARFDLGCIDVSFLEKGIPYGEIPDVCMIYITKKDFLKRRRGIYRVEKTICETQEIAADGVSEIYANLTVEPENKAQAELLDFIKRSDSYYQTDLFPHLADKVTRMKEEKEGIGTMCEIMEEKWTEGKVEGEAKLVSIIRKKLGRGKIAADIAEELELERDYVDCVVRLITEDSARDDLQVAGMLVRGETSNG